MIFHENDMNKACREKDLFKYFVRKIILILGVWLNKLKLIFNIGVKYFICSLTRVKSFIFGAIGANERNDPYQKIKWVDR